jgi:hypothetical protein
MLKEFVLNNLKRALTTLLHDDKAQINSKSFCTRISVFDSEADLPLEESKPTPEMRKNI